MTKAMIKVVRFASSDATDYPETIREHVGNSEFEVVTIDPSLVNIVSDFNALTEGAGFADISALRPAMILEILRSGPSRTRIICVGNNLSHAGLRGANLHGVNLSRAGLHRADLHGADLSDADLSDADLSHAGLRGANLHGANLSHAGLRGANLHGAALSGANLSHADLYGARNIVTVGPIGSRGDTLYAVRHDAALMIRTGCFWGSLEEFKAANEARLETERRDEYRTIYPLLDHFWKQR